MIDIIARRGQYDDLNIPNSNVRVGAHLERIVITFKRQGATLPVVQFQKGRYPRSQLTELYQIRVEPI